MTKIITISRQFGSGGRTIGRKVAEKLGIPCYDSEIIEKISERSHFSENYIKESGEYSESFLSKVFSYRPGYTTQQDKLWLVQHEIIKELAEKESCVIVGRCADYILRDRSDCFKVFIHASMEKRAERIVKEYGERKESPEERLMDKDKRRETYYRFYTDLHFGDARNYLLTLDSGILGIDKCVELILDCVNHTEENKA